MLTPFHLAIGVSDLSAAEVFYRDVLGCTLGRRSDQWIDFNLFGHQLVCHEVLASAGAAATNPVDGENVPVPHFGVVLALDAFESLKQRLVAQGVTFVIEPQTRFQGEAGEQRTMFLLDPSKNAIEFKAFRNIDESLFKA
ncbi:MAG: VOC family protein [Gammaproteobacteria bacterium]|jgi:extradiol dioxygenase family protein|nr:VOC family protein [Gammaproteobacteria bacterium]MBT5053233.1 VOC family protein [Gammaproteobacteria bacterium]